MNKRREIAQQKRTSSQLLLISYSTTMLRRLHTAKHSLKASRSYTRYPHAAGVITLNDPFGDSHSLRRNGALSVSSRQYHVSRRDESSVIIGGVVLLVGATVAQKVMQAQAAKAASQGNDEVLEENESKTTSGNESADTAAEEATTKASSGASTQASKKKKAPGAASGGGGLFGDMMTSWFAKNFYDGGFEEKMTKREAALILGVRESATPERIKDAHRRILLLNHPDRGGSVFIAAKVNEAKDLLMKGK